MSAAVELAKLVKELLENSSTWPSAIEIDVHTSDLNGDMWALEAERLANQLLGGAA